MERSREIRGSQTLLIHPMRLAWYPAPRERPFETTWFQRDHSESTVYRQIIQACSFAVHTSPRISSRILQEAAKSYFISYYALGNSISTGPVPPQKQRCNKALRTRILVLPATECPKQPALDAIMDKDLWIKLEAMRELLQPIDERLQITSGTCVASVERPF